MHPRAGQSVAVRFALPAPELRPYVTTYYRSEFRCRQSEQIEDYLHPEWANLRFVAGVAAQAAIGQDPITASPAFAVTGPTSRATRFRIGRGHSWGLGLLPLGWASFFGVAASDYANRCIDGRRDPAFRALVPLADALAHSSGDYAEDLALIEAHMARLLDQRMAVDPAIVALNDALVDPAMTSVADLTERLGMNVRSLERLSRRVFGFAPKLLLRRQRFLRSLARFMLDPSLTWLKTLDRQYHDQSHFIRDFRYFMGMSPRAYARLDKPMMVAAAQARMAIAGEPLQALHPPTSDAAR